MDLDLGVLLVGGEAGDALGKKPMRSLIRISPSWSRSASRRAASSASVSAPFCQSPRSRDASRVVEEANTDRFGARSIARRLRSSGTVAPPEKQASRKRMTRPCSAIFAMRSWNCPAGDRPGDQRIVAARVDAVRDQVELVLVDDLAVAGEEDDGEVLAVPRRIASRSEPSSLRIIARVASAFASSLASTCA